MKRATTTLFSEHVSGLLLGRRRRSISSAPSWRSISASSKIYASASVAAAEIHQTPSSSSSSKATTGASSFPYYVVNSPETRVSVLPNGLRVASETCHGVTASVGVWIDAGSRYETAENNGAAHFLEHMAFKGTRRRTQMQLEMEVENMGAHLNAYTSREQTVYYAKVFENNVEHAVDILSDILTCSRLDEMAVERERSVILREMIEVNKLQEEVILDHLHEVAFQGTGLGRTILGPEENVRSLTRGELKNYITTHYTAPRMVVAGAGAIQHEELVALAAKYFGHLPARPPPGANVGHDKAVFTGADKRVLNLKEEKAYVAIAFEGASWKGEYAFPLMVLQTMLGGWDRASGQGANVVSPMGQELAEKGLCHMYTTFNTCYKDTGLFGIYTVADPETLREMTQVIVKHMQRLCEHITDEEVNRAKTQLKANMLMQLDSFAHVCEDIGRQILTYDRRMSPAEIFSRIDAIDKTDMMLCANKILNDEDHAMSAVGPISKLPSYAEIRNRFGALKC